MHKVQSHRCEMQTRVMGSRAMSISTTKGVYGTMRGSQGGGGWGVWAEGVGVG